MSLTVKYQREDKKSRQETRDPDSPSFSIFPRALQCARLTPAIQFFV